MKIKIIFILPNLEAGGSEKVTLNIIQQLDKSVFDIFLIVLNQRGDLHEYISKDINLIVLAVNKTLYAFPIFLYYCWKIKPNYIFSSLNRLNVMSIMSSMLFRSIETIIREPNMPSKQFKNLPFYTMKLVTVFYPRAYRIIAQTDEMKEEMILLYDLPKSKIDVKPNPMNGEMIQNLIKDELNPFPNDQINILAVGSLVKRKGFDVLIRSFSIVANLDTKIYLYILGKGVEENALRQLVFDLNLEGRVIFVGFQKNPYPYIKHAELFVLSSIFEGLPNVVLESLFLKTRVVITDCVPFISNLVLKSKSGLIAKINDVQDLGEKIMTELTKDFDFPDFIDYTETNFNTYFIELENENIA